MEEIKKLKNYQNKLRIVKEAILKEKQPEKLAQLETLQRDIEKAISFQTDLIKFQNCTNTSHQTVIKEKISLEWKDKKCEILVNGEPKTGQIIDVNLQDEIVDVVLIGQRAIKKVQADQVELLKAPEAKELVQGLQVKALQNDGS